MVAAAAARLPELTAALRRSWPDLHRLLHPASRVRLADRGHPSRWCSTHVPICFHRHRLRRRFRLPLARLLWNYCQTARSRDSSPPNRLWRDAWRVPARVGGGPSLYGWLRIANSMAPPLRRLGVDSRLGLEHDRFHRRCHSIRVDGRAARADCANPDRGRRRELCVDDARFRHPPLALQHRGNRHFDPVCTVSKPLSFIDARGHRHFLLCFLPHRGPLRRPCTVAALWFDQPAFGRSRPADSVALPAPAPTFRPALSAADDLHDGHHPDRHDDQAHFLLEGRQQHPPLRRRRHHLHRPVAGRRGSTRGAALHPVAGGRKPGHRSESLPTRVRVHGYNRLSTSEAKR